MENLVAPAVVDAEVELAAVVMAALLARVAHELLQAGAEGRELAEEVHADAVLLHDLDGLDDIALEDVHDRMDLVVRALPVLGGKGVERKILDADVLAVIGDFAHGLGADGVAGGAGQTALFCPASVAVEDDGDMTRQTRGIKRGGVLPRFFLLKNGHKRLLSNDVEKGDLGSPFSDVRYELP